MVANLTQILNLKANFLQEFELFSKNKIFANNGGHFKIVSIIKKNIKFVHIRSYNLKKTVSHFQLSNRARASLPHNKHLSKIFNFYIKNDNFRIFLKTKSDQNVHQIAPF